VTKISRGAVAVATILAFALAPAISTAKGGGEVRKSGTGTEGSRWDLKAKSDDGALEVEFEVDQNVVGDRWKVTMKRNGDRFFKGIRVTRAPSGSFSVEERVPDGPGVDRIRAKAVNKSTGEVATGKLSI